MREINDMLFTRVLLLGLCDDIYPSWYYFIIIITSIVMDSPNLSLPFLKITDKNHFVRI